eukprot:6492414-Amphidinium_carterae.1
MRVKSACLSCPPTASGADSPVCSAVCVAAPARLRALRLDLLRALGFLCPASDASPLRPCDAAR